MTMRLLIFACAVFLAAVNAASAERLISTSQATAVFLGTRGVTTEYERVYVADNGSGDVFIRRAVELSGFANAEYISLTNANAQQAVSDPDAVFVLPANILENGIFLPLFNNPSTAAFVPTDQGLEPITLSRIDGMQILAARAEPLPQSTLPVIALDDPSTLLVAVNGGFPDRLRLTSYRVRPDMALLTSRLQEASIEFAGVIEYQQGTDTSQIVQTPGQGILFLPELVDDGPIRLLAQNEQARFYAVHALGISPVALPGAVTPPVGVVGAEPSIARPEPSAGLVATNPMAEADNSAVLLAVLETRILELATEFRQDQQTPPWFDLNGPSNWVMFVSPEAFARAALIDTEAFRSQDLDALKAIEINPISLSRIDRVNLPAFGTVSRFEIARHAEIGIEHDLANIGMPVAANAHGQSPLTAEVLEGQSVNPIVVLSRDLLEFESLWRDTHRIPFVLTSEGLLHVRLTNGAPPEPENVYISTDDMVVRLEHRAMRAIPGRPIFAVAVPRSSGFGDRAVGFVARERGARPGTTTIQIRGQRITQQTIQLLPQQLRRPIVEDLLGSHTLPVTFSSTLSLPAFDQLFEGSYEFWDAEGRIVTVPLLPPLQEGDAVDQEPQQEVALQVEVCGVSEGPIVVSRETISIQRGDTVVYPSGAPELLVAIASSSVNVNAIAQPYSDIRLLLESGMVEIIVLPDPDAARALGFDQACENFVFSVLE